MSSNSVWRSIAQYREADRKAHLRRQ